MTKEECLIRSIIGTGKAGRLDSRIFAYAVSLARRMMFQEGIPMEEILVTKTIYPEAGRRYRKKPKTAARAIERLGNHCWERMTKEQKENYLGETQRHLAPKEMVLLMGWYCEFGKSYREMEWEQYGEMFTSLKEKER